nr:hypothetical protein [Tanacetum cinerariifolium]
MSTTKFAETYNLVAFLEKPAESEGFEQIADFLYANPINNALTVNPAIYNSCIQQFWDSSKVKTVNEDVHIRALVDGEKLIVNEASIRHDLKLEDAEGTTCLPNDTIFKELARMGAKTTAWDEFSSTIAFVIICLAANQKFSLSMYILDNMVFANMKREGKGFSGIITHLFDTMMVQAPEDMGESSEESVPTPSNDPLPSGEDRMQLSELMKLCTKVSDRVLSLEQIKTNQAAEIEKLKKRVKKLEGKKKKRTHGLKRIHKFGLSARIVSSDEDGLCDQKDASKQGRIAKIDADEDIFLIGKIAQDQGRMNDKDMFRVNDLDGDEVIVDVTAGENVKQSTKVAEKEISTAEVVTTAEDVEVTTAATTLQISKDELTLARTLMEIKAAKPKARGAKDKEMMKETLKKTQAEVTEGSFKRARDEIEQESVKRQRLEKKDDTAELKRCSKIVPEDDVDVTIEATPLSSKSSTIKDVRLKVDYEVEMAYDLLRLIRRCINLGELLPRSSTKVYLERQPDSTSFVFLELKFFRECAIRRMWTIFNYYGKISLTRLTTERYSCDGIFKKKEKVTVEKCKGVYLLSEVALTEEARYKEVRKKSLRDFHKTHPSSFGTVTKITPSAAKIKPFVTNEGTGAKPGVPDVTKKESSSDQESDSGDDNTKYDKEKGPISSIKLMRMNRVSNLIKKRMKKPLKMMKRKRITRMGYTTNQFDDDVDVGLNEPVNTDEGLIQKEGRKEEDYECQATQVKAAVEKSSKPPPAPKPKVTKEKPSKASTAKPPKLKSVKEKSTKTTLPEQVGKGKIVKFRKAKSPFQLVDEPGEEPAYFEPEPELEHQGKGDDDEMERAIQMSLKTFQAQSQTSSIGDTKVLQITEELGEDVGKQQNIKENTVELNQGQARPDPGRTPESLPLPEQEVMDEDQARPDPGRTPESLPLPEQEVMDEDQARPDPGESRGALVGPDLEPTHDKFMADLYPKVQESLKSSADEHVFVKDPISLTMTLSSMKNLEDAFSIGDQFINDKSTKDEPEKPNVEAKVVFMVTIPIYQAYSSVPPLSTPIPVIDLSPPKPASSTTQAPVFTATTITPLLPPPQQQSSTESEVLEIRDLPHKINEVVRDKVKEAVQIALQAPIRDRFRDLSEEDMKEMLHQRMFESCSYKYVHEHISLYEVLEAKALPTTYQALAENSLLEKTRDMRTFMHWYCQQMGKTELTQADFKGQVDWANPEGDQVRIDISKPLPLSGPPAHALSISKLKDARYLDFGLEQLVPEHMWINEVCTYDISASYGISHWWFNCQKFYIDRHIANSSRKVVRTHMRILSVVSIKAFSRYEYDYLKEITLHRVDYQEYTIMEKNFKSLYPSDFEDLNLLLLQGHLKHLSVLDKHMLSTAVKLWTRKLVI